MTRYTDARLALSIDGVDITTATDIHVTFRQGGVMLDITNVTIVDGSLIVSLTQKQTKMFSASPKTTEVQVNMLIGEKRVATDIAKITIADNLLRTVWE